MAKQHEPRTADTSKDQQAPEPPPEAYEPIACGIHDRLEDLATRGVRCAIEYRSPTGETLRRVARFLDIYASDGVEYLELSSGERVRLDWIRAFGVED